MLRPLFRPAPAGHARFGRVVPRCEPLERRDVPASLGTALFYNVLVFGDLTAPNGGDTEGRMAVGGTATFLDNYVIGAPPPNSSPNGAQLPLDPTRDDFIVGGDVNNLGGFAWVVNGNDVHEGTFTGPPLLHSAGTSRQQSPVLLSPQNGNAVTVGGESFATLHAELTALSQFWGGLPDAGARTEFRDAGVLNLVGTDPVLNVFNVTADEWSGKDLIRNIDAPAGSTVLVNISGQAVTVSGGDLRLNGVDRQHLVLNFFEATTITSTLSDYQGTVLAPLASATFNGGILTGNGIFGGDVVQGGGFENHNFRFLGSLPSIPPPPVAVPPVAPPVSVVPPVVPPTPPPVQSVVFPPQLGAAIAPVSAPAVAPPVTAPVVAPQEVSKRLFLASTLPSTPPVFAPAPADVTVATAWLGPTRVAYATGPGVAPAVLVIDTRTGAELFRVNPFTPTFTGGLSLAGGDVTGDGVLDVIVGAGPGGGPAVAVFDGATGAELRTFFAYAADFTGGVNVAAADVTGDGRADIITAPASAGGPHVRVFDGATGAEVASFFAYAPTVVGGVTLAAGDTNADGRAEVVTVPSAGFAPHVRVWQIAGGAATEVGSFFAFDPSFTGGVSPAVADVNGDGRAEVLATPGVGGGPLVRAFTPTGSPVLDRMAFDAGFRGGLRLAAGDFNGDLVPDVLVGPASAAQPVVRLLPGASLDGASDFDLAAAFPGVFVG